MVYRSTSRAVARGVAVLLAVMAGGLLWGLFGHVAHGTGQALGSRTFYLLPAVGVGFTIGVVLLLYRRLRRAQVDLEAASARSARSEAWFQAIFQQANVGIAVLDASGTLCDCNVALERMLGYEPGALAGTPLNDITPLAERDGAMRRLQATFSGRVENYRLQRSFLHRNGTAVVGDVWVSALPNTHTHKPVVLGVVVDVTERERVEQALRDSHARLVQGLQRERETRDALERTMAELTAARDRAEAGSRIKSEFLANMSHEIRTPLTAIKGYADILADECPRVCDFGKHVVPEHLGNIQRNAGHLAEVINDMLDLSRIEAEQFELELGSTEPTAIVEDVAAAVAPLAEDKGLTFETEIMPPIPAIVRSDPKRMRQVLLNLGQNAVKFTERGAVRLRLRYEGDERGFGHIIFEMSDTGVGIPADRHEEIFLPFAQIDGSVHRQQGGAGLGLALCRRLTVLMGGVLTVESSPGVGSTFCLSIPVGMNVGVPMLDETTIGVRRASSVPAQGDVDLAGINVLLVEDGVDNRRLIARLLELAGANVTHAENGQVAVDLATEVVAAGAPFHVILMDMQMPVLDGYAAARALRQLGYIHPIVAVTAHAMTDDREKCLAAGCDEYLTKPIDRRQLLAVVDDFARQAAVMP